MEVQVEPFVIDPERAGEVPRHGEHPLPHPRRQMQTLLDDVLDVVVRERPVLTRREHRHTCHVHVHRGTLEVQEARIQARETLRPHGRLRQR